MQGHKRTTLDQFATGPEVPAFHPFQFSPPWNVVGVWRVNDVEDAVALRRKEIKP